jgi:hypothetical protein
LKGKKIFSQPFTKTRKSFFEQKMILNPVKIALLVAVLAVGYYIFFGRKQQQQQQINLMKVKPNQIADLGMYDAYNPDRFGTTKEMDRRVTNYGVRAEYNWDPMPLGEGCGECSKYGVPDPALGHTHVCKAGPPSKRAVDANGGWFQLNHICAPSTGQDDEPTQLGRGWRRRGCAQPESVGLDIRPMCSRCGN